MAVFKGTLAKDFLDNYDGLELMKQYTPKIAKLPSITYKPYYKKPISEVAQVAMKLGKATQDEVDALEKAFNERFGDK